MELKDIPIDSIRVSKFNARKNLEDGQADSSISDLAASIRKQGLLNPITVMPKSDSTFDVVAGQRRYLACQRLGWSSIPSIVKNKLNKSDVTAISLIENVHRADMNPMDKAIAFKAIQSSVGDVADVANQTGISTSTVRKYLRLLNLSDELQQRLAAGEARNTSALAQLAGKFSDSSAQEAVWGKIEGFTQNVQSEILRRVGPGLENLNDLVDLAAEGALGFDMVKNCPFDCPKIPDHLKEKVAQLIAKKT